MTMCERTQNKDLFCQFKMHFGVIKHTHTRAHTHVYLYRGDKETKTEITQNVNRQNRWCERVS